MNCKPGEMATVVRCYSEGCCIAPYEVFGFSVQVDQLIPDSVVPVWRLKHPLKITVQNPYYSVITHRSFYPGDVMSVFALEDACLQPWRAKPQEKGESIDLIKGRSNKFIVKIDPIDEEKFKKAFCKPIQQINESLLGSLKKRIRDMERYDNAAHDPLGMSMTEQIKILRENTSSGKRVVDIEIDNIDFNKKPKLDLNSMSFEEKLRLLDQIQRDLCLAPGNTWLIRSTAHSTIHGKTCDANFRKNGPKKS